MSEDKVQQPWVPLTFGFEAVGNLFKTRESVQFMLTRSTVTTDLGYLFGQLLILLAAK